jgi:hypothetical protein
MPRHRPLLFLVAVPAFILSGFAQQQTAPPKPQTARQALIEIVTKGGDAVQKHLTVEVQDFLKSNAKVTGPAMAILHAPKPDSSLHAFETGEVLIAYDDSAQHVKYEVHVDSDDLAGDEDTLALSIHVIRDGKEQNEIFGLMSAHFAVLMKLQQNIWRVDKISVGTEFPVGDPKFFAKGFLNPAAETGDGMVGVKIGPADGIVEAGNSTIPPEQVVRQLGMAESIFAQAHPELGFSCSLSELAETTKLLQIDPQVNSGIYNGYRFSLSGCEGKPAGSFRIVAEPAMTAPQTKAYCSDATQNVRASEDGRGTTCLSAGKPLIPGAEGVAGVHLSKPLDDSKK